MPAKNSDPRVTVALIGNPNTGKSTLFNGLCGVRQRVGNYPGVTVEKKVGHIDFHGRRFSLVDLPGSYSLAPRSPDEMVAVDVLLGRRTEIREPDAVLCIVDASNLERNLYLVSQVLELGKPTVIALNMTDVARERGITLDVEGLRRRLGGPVVEIQANRKLGLDALRQALCDVVDRPHPGVTSPFPDEFQQEVAGLKERITQLGHEPLPRYLVERLLLDTTGYLMDAGIPGIDATMRREIDAARGRLAEANLPVPAVEAMSRYQWVATVLDGLVARPAERPRTTSDKLDQLLTHRVWGTLAFLVVMLLMFQAVFRIAEPSSAFIDDTFKPALSGAVSATLNEGPLHSLLTKGVIEGVGGVLVFLPQILVLFLFIAILEDCGYMARAAYLMDRLMSRVGLSGKSFIPLLSSFACAIPGIMSARVIENPRDRLVTILIAPLMSCSARLPVYTLLIEAFIPNHKYLGGFLGLRGLTLFAMYSLGIVASVLVTLVLRRTILRGAAPPFVMELPSYKFPEPRLVLHRMLERGWAFVRRAGTLIFAVTVLVWAAAYYPHDSAAIDPNLLAARDQLQARLASARGAERDAVTDELSSLEDRVSAQYLSHSFLGRAGRWVEPAVRPLGWDWRIGCAAIASFPAREVVIATLGVIYSLGEDEDEQSDALRETLREATWHNTDRPVFNIPVALSIMVFFALCAQCASTLAVMRRETNSWRWPMFTFVYMTGLAYVAAMLTYQVGSALGG